MTTAESADWHVYPVEDLREHTFEGGSCWCRPVLDFADNGTAVYIHNALDGREKYERGELLPH